ncbi:Mut7-C RNAse domain-containing protein [Lysobacter arvi]|uniref:Mut7-C RNAse domain-containing protein n=1 Tax=Lysobacter arvi TaxID=3038776 RepID=A0ABU1CBT6_9GAMM|nr:Mut7-C RNAse domain-containing protein [Lysobacter arvi]MDR0182550.1 Mut7-C RNAse domain-containing protein [Lysobacter arvi]
MPNALHQHRQSTCEFRFYEELGDFLAPNRRKRSFLHAFDGTPSVKDRIESLGVPHTEVDLILVDGEPVPFSHRLTGGERVAVYPTFERFELGQANRLRPAPLREPRFVLDVHLGRLASYLRLLGFDTLYRNDYEDDELEAISRSQHRILLSRDTGLLKRSAVTHGAFLHATDPRRQLCAKCSTVSNSMRASRRSRAAPAATASSAPWTQRRCDANPMSTIPTGTRPTSVIRRPTSANVAIRTAANPNVAIPDARRQNAIPDRPRPFAIRPVLRRKSTVAGRTPFPPACSRAVAR